jgi:hypothetical protein
MEFEGKVWNATNYPLPLGEGAKRKPVRAKRQERVRVSRFAATETLTRRATAICLGSALFLRLRAIALALRGGSRFAWLSRVSLSQRERLFGLYIFLLFSLFRPPTAQAEVIDKVLAVVDGHIITASDLRQERDILMRLNEKPVDDDKALVQQLIDNYLIETQISDFPGIDVTDADVDRELDKAVTRESAPSPALREAVRLRVRMRKYFEMRFVQFIQASDEDISKYYNDIFVPEAKKRELNPIPPLTQVTELIRNNVIQESLSHEINIWLEAIRRRSNIEVFE